jgi:hypothetical protein
MSEGERIRDEGLPVYRRRIKIEEKKNMGSGIKNRIRLHDEEK